MIGFVVARSSAHLLRNIRGAVLSTFRLTGLATLANVAGLPLGGRLTWMPLFRYESNTSTEFPSP